MLTYILVNVFSVVRLYIQKAPSFVIQIILSSLDKIYRKKNTIQKTKANLKVEYIFVFHVINVNMKVEKMSRWRDVEKDYQIHNDWNIYQNLVQKKKSRRCRIVWWITILFWVILGKITKTNSRKQLLSKTGFYRDRSIYYIFLIYLHTFVI